MRSPIWRYLKQERNYLGTLITIGIYGIDRGSPFSEEGTESLKSNEEKKKDKSLKSTEQRPFRKAASMAPNASLA